MAASFLGVFLFGMLGWPELIIIVLVVMLLFGATKLPKLGKGLGEGIRNFKKGITGEDTGDDELSEDNEKNDKKDAQLDTGKKE